MRNLRIKSPSDFRPTVSLLYPRSCYHIETRQLKEGKGEWEKVDLNISRTKLLTCCISSTGQQLEIDVNYEPERKGASNGPKNITLWASVLGCVALLLITVAMFICFLDRPDRSQPSVAPSTPRFAAPVTPDHSSPAVLSDQSPRTPQPFMEYVRRTIDETPYYRRDRRRGFNPQNTF